MSVDFYTADEATTKKKEFAAALMRDPLHPEKAALSIESRATHVSYILNNWQYDREVNGYMAEIREEKGAAATIPTKEEFAATLFSEGNAARTSDVKLDYFKLFAEVMGYIDKGKGTVVNNNNNLIQQRNVIVLPAKRPAKEIEGELMEQQRQLINE